MTADRGSLIVLPEDRKLKVRFAGTTKIQGLRYEIRSLDTEDLIERTQVTSLDAAINGDSENDVSAELLIQKMCIRDRANSIISLQGRVQVPTGGKAREPRGMIR